MADTDLTTKGINSLSKFIPLINKAPQDIQTNLFHDLMMLVLYGIMIGGFAVIVRDPFPHKGVTEIIIYCVLAVIFLGFVFHCYTYQINKRSRNVK